MRWRNERSNRPWFRLASLVGTLPAGGSFCSVKRNQNPLRAFPPKDLPGVRGWTCVKSRFGPSPLLWLLLLPSHQATLGSWPYGWVISLSGPTLEKRRSHRRRRFPSEKSEEYNPSVYKKSVTNSRFSAPPPAAACQPFGRRRPWWQTPPGTRSDRRCPGESRALGRGGDSLGRWRQR